MSQTTLARRATAWVVPAMFIAGLLAVTPGALAQTTVLGVPVPDQVGGLSHSAPLDFETRSPGMGYGLRFSRTDWTIDVFIYDLQMKSISNDPESAAVRAALDEAKGEIVHAEQGGNYAGVTLKDTFTIRDAAGRGRFICAEYNYFHKRRAVDLDSYLCLAGVRRKFFQIRMDTMKTSRNGDEVRRFVVEWARAWMPVLWPS
jgi:hypothetical protein